jgi:DNA (cytosine-5)-methyltransferase 1
VVRHPHDPIPFCGGHFRRDHLYRLSQLPELAVAPHKLGSATLLLFTFTDDGQPGQEAREPLHTITGGASHFAEVRAFLIKYYGKGVGQNLNDPLHTVTATDRMGLVTVAGEEYAITDIGLRMLSPQELYRAQGFPDNYIFDRGAYGRPLSKTAQVRMCGNSVCPPVAAALVKANYRDIELERVA